MSVPIADAPPGFDPLERAVPEAEDGMRAPFQRDRDRIVFSKALRRLMHKTQVFIAPTGDHYRVRLTHTLEVATISRGTARALGLDEDLTEAIAMGHDLGHPPFGHAGEEALDLARRSADGGRFRHNEHSVRIVETLEKGGHGLNLTAAVRDGIRHHTGPVDPQTREGQIVKTMDRVAYINHDIDDAVRAGWLDEAELPSAAIAVLGATAGERIDTLVRDMVDASRGRPRIAQSERVGTAMLDLRRFMFEHVYLGAAARIEAAKARHVVGTLFEWYRTHPEHIPGRPTDEDSVQRAIDWVAGMTDRYALRDYRRRFEPREAPV